MIHFFRKFFNSKFGVPITLAFLALIAFAFASGDVSNTGSFGGISDSNTVVVVGDEKISTAELSSTANSAVQNLREQNPTLSMPAFIEQDGLKDVLDQLIERMSLSAFAREYGLRAGKNLVNSEIIEMDAFKGPSGNFDQTVYRQALSSRNLTDARVRADLSSGLLAQQLLVPASFGAKAPDALVSRYAALLKESRQGTIGLIQSTAFLPEKEPSAAELKTYYTENKGDYIRPERRVLRFISFDDEILGEIPAPSEQQLAARYKKQSDIYAPKEMRGLTQLIVPTKQAADSIRERVQKGASLNDAAREAGLRSAKVAPVTKDLLTENTSAAVAETTFATAKGELAETARSPLGFHIIRVDTIERDRGKSLEQAKPEILAAMRVENRQKAMADLTADVEDKLDSGVSLSDVAKQLKLEVTSTQPAVASGQLYDDQSKTIPPILASALETAFQMELSKPQLGAAGGGAAGAGTQYLAFEVTEITQSAAAPLAEVKDVVTRGWKLSEGSSAAKKAAERILKRLAEGDSLAKAMGAEETKLSSPETINLSREQLAAAGGRVPAPLMLMFSMAEGTAKRLEAPGKAGWFVVDLDKIETGTIAKDDPIYAQTRNELGIAIGREYSEQLRGAITKDILPERNEAAIKSVRDRLAGKN